MKWSFIGLFATALIQIVVVLLSGSVALLSDTIHNFGDAATAAVPLWIAFALSRLRPSLNHRLLHELRYIDRAVVHVDPVQESGEEHHRIGPHSHDGIPTHSH